jgi:hypothetical protein
MVIGFLCPISVEGVIRKFRWDIGPEGAEALSSQHIWTFILGERGCTHIRTNGQKNEPTDGMNIHM